MISLQMYFKQNFIRRLRNLTSSSLISARSAMRNQNNYLFGVNIFKSVSVLCKIRSILSPLAHYSKVVRGVGKRGLTVLFLFINFYCNTMADRFSFRYVRAL